MPERSLTLEADFIKRLDQFIGSKLFNCASSVAKSNFWQYHSDKLVTETSAGRVKISGEAGFYIPSQASHTKKLFHKVAMGVKEPSMICKAITSRVKSYFEVPRLVSYSDAFDAVMRDDLASDPIFSNWRVDHLKLTSRRNVLSSSASIAKHYQTWSSYAATDHVINSYYYQNILRGFVRDEELHSVIEIGGGNGNLASILYHDWSPVRLILVDLPETIAVAFTFLANLFPKAKFVLPNEFEGVLPEQFDFALLTVDQLELVSDDSVDLAINCHSFQEMTHEQIAVYYDFIQRVCRNSGYFFTANRIEKIPCSPVACSREESVPPNRFAEYPWNANNETLIYEISRLLRLVQLDAVAIRLERIRK